MKVQKKFKDVKIGEKFTAGGGCTIWVKIKDSFDDKNIQNYETKIKEHWLGAPYSQDVEVDEPDIIDLI